MGVLRNLNRFLFWQFDDEARFGYGFFNRQLERHSSFAMVCHPNLPCTFPRRREGQVTQRQRRQTIRALGHGGDSSLDRLGDIKKTGSRQRLRIGGAVLVHDGVCRVEQQRLDLCGCPTGVRLHCERRCAGHVRCRK